MEAGVGQDDHLTIIVGQQGMKGLVVDVAVCAVPIGHQAQLVEHHAEFATHDPAMIGLAFLADLTRPSSFSH